MTDKSWQVYILKCADDTLYTGITNDIQRRLDQHNQGKGAKYTRARRPVILIYQESANCRSSASQREAAIKKLSRNDKLKLLNSTE